ncbi:MAG: conjugal transfer protein [Tomitella sp.]|nr:conjugal transfer protein [Tomitella sp.]
MTSNNTTKSGGENLPVVPPPGYNPAREQKSVQPRAVYARYQPARRSLDNAWRGLVDLPAIVGNPTREPTFPAAGDDSGRAPAEPGRAGDATAAVATAPETVHTSAADGDESADDVDCIETNGVRHYLYVLDCGRGEYRASSADHFELADSNGGPIRVDKEGRALDDLKQPLRKRISNRIAQIRAKIDGTQGTDTTAAAAPIYDANGVPITDFDVPGIGKKPGMGGQYRGRRILAITVAGGLVIGAVGITAGAYMGRSAVPAAGMISPSEASAYRLTTFPLDAAAAFGKQYLDVCLTHGDNESVKKRQQLLASMATPGAGKSCGWTAGGSQQDAEMIVWNGSMRPAKAEFGSGKAAYLGYTVSTSDGQYYTATVPIWAKSATDANDFRVVGDIGMSSPPRVATPPPAESQYDSDSSLATQVQDSIVKPFLTAWAASDKSQLNLVLADNAEPDARTGLGGAVESPKIQSVEVLSPRKTSAGSNKSVTYEDGDKVLAEAVVEWHVPASESKQVTGYRIELHRAAGKWQVYDVDGGLVDTEGGGAGATGIGGADSMVPGSASEVAGK